MFGVAAQYIFWFVIITDKTVAIDEKNIKNWKFVHHYDAYVSLYTTFNEYASIS